MAHLTALPGRVAGVAEDAVPAEARTPRELRLNLGVAVGKRFHGHGEDELLETTVGVVERVAAFELDAVDDVAEDALIAVHACK